MSEKFDKEHPPEGWYRRKSDGAMAHMEYGLGGRPRIKYTGPQGTRHTNYVSARGLLRAYTYEGKTK